MNLELIQKLSLQEKKVLEQRCLKLMEESGELATEILIASKASGSQYKNEGKDGIFGECVDVVLVTLSIFFKAGGTIEMLNERLTTKAQKWEQHQLK